MRAKIIAINAAIIILVGLLTFVLVKGAVSSATGNTAQFMSDAKRNAQAASARVQLDGLRTERWLSSHASDAALADVMAKASPEAREDAATTACNGILAAAKTSPAFAGNVPSIVVLIDERGKIIGRNDTNAGRRDDIGALYPGLKEALTTGQSGSEIWANQQHNDQYLASYVLLRNEAGKIVGALAAGLTLNDELSRVSDATTGRVLKLVREGGSGVEVLASSQGAKDAMAAALDRDAKSALDSASASGVTSLLSGSVIVAGAVLDGLSHGKKVVLITAIPAAYIDSVTELIGGPVLMAMVLGILFVIIAGWLLGNYISRPIEILEEGLLAIINGQSDKRFQLDHPELGGIAFRIDQLLNQLMGVEEDNSDAEGRVSLPPARPPADALDDNKAGDAGLASEPADAYYQRVYGEYIEAKKSLGEPTDHISLQAFRGKIEQMEKDAAAKQGKSVRYKVQLRGKEVTLIAVPLG